jgi:hypothetical protein
LVAVQTQEEQQGPVFAAIGCVALGITAIAAGIILDPVGRFLRRI